MFVKGGGDKLGGATNLYRLPIGLSFRSWPSSDYAEFLSDFPTEDSAFSVNMSMCSCEKAKCLDFSDILSLFVLYNIEYWFN